MNTTANLWLHVPSQQVCTLRGEDRDISGAPYAVMVAPDGVVARIDPLDLMLKDGDWQKVGRENS